MSRLVLTVMFAALGSGCIAHGGAGTDDRRPRGRWTVVTGAPAGSRLHAGRSGLPPAASPREKNTQDQGAASPAGHRPAGHRPEGHRPAGHRPAGARSVPLPADPLNGLATWYGRPFHGKRNASGEIYDMHGLTAAHRTLPFGTIVRVTSLRNQREVDVRITDRGPFGRGRIIDLSLGAARR
ncbi:MAG: septal ring lytic transglycosylase RlpA family protein, partial [Polyangia bacterium]|nr:septal ring lytic transglycosylase RlpA family protein [Polyangia bacterium]